MQQPSQAILEIHQRPPIPVPPPTRTNPTGIRPPPTHPMNGKDAIAGSGSEHQYTPKNILVTGGAGFMYVEMGVWARSSR